MKCIRNISLLFLMSATAVSLEICTLRLWRISRNIICLDLQEHRFSLLIPAEQKIQNSLLQVRPLETSFTATRLWMRLTIKMFFHSGWIILKRWMWKKKLQTKWSGILTVKRLWWLLSVFVLWHSTYWNILTRRPIVGIKPTSIIRWLILQRWLLPNGTR